MAQNIIDTKIREAYDTEANWIKHNPVLLAGQLAFSSDKYGKYKVGNGTSTWSQLQYVTLNWGDIGGKPSFAPTTHNHTISQITDIGNASVKYATTAGSANTTSQIIDPSDKHGINISYVDEVNTTSWIPVYKDRNHMSTISTNNLRNAIGAAQASHSHNNYLSLSGGIVPNLNAILADIKTNDNITPTVASIATSPFARFYWHDHFAFLNSHTIVNHQVMLNGQSSWVNSYLDIKRLFCQKEYASRLELLEKNQLARRFTLKCSSFSYCGICWIEIGLCWTEVFSHFEVHIESSIDNAKWTTIHRSTFSHNQNGFLKIDDIAQANYLRFTFTKKTQLTTGTVSLNSIKGLTYRKGDQGLGIEYETPFDWDVNRNIYPHGNMSANLGTGSNKWKSVYAENFIGNVQGKSTSSDYLHVYDTRNENPMPNDKGFRKQAISFDFKFSSTIGNPIANGHDFAGLMSFAPWSETSGGNGYQMAFGFNASDRTTPRLAIRTADLSATSWNSWYKIYTSADKPTLAELGAAAASHTHNYAPTSHTHTIANITNIAEASVKKAISSDVTSAIKDSNNGRSINISYQDQEVSTASWFPVWVGNNKIGTINPTNVRNVIKASPIDHTHSHVPNADTANLANYIKDKSDNRPIGISHLLETTTATRFPVWNSDNTLVTMTATNFRKSISAAPDNHNHDTIYASNSHSHSSIHDCNSGSSIGISSTLGVTATTVGKYDIVVTNTSVYGNKFVAMDKGSLVDTIANDVNGRITINAISNAQIDSLAKL